MSGRNNPKQIRAKAQAKAIRKVAKKAAPGKKRATTKTRAR